MVATSLVSEAWRVVMRVAARAGRGPDALHARVSEERSEPRCGAADQLSGRGPRRLRCWAERLGGCGLRGLQRRVA